MMDRSPAGRNPEIFSFTPHDPIPTCSPSHVARVSASLRAVGPARLRYRARCLWETDIGLREEIITFADPRGLLRLLQAVHTKPDRPLKRVDLEAIARPKWEPVPLEWVIARAEQRERREAEKVGKP